MAQSCSELIAVQAIAQRIPDLRAAGANEVAAMLRANAAMLWPRLESAAVGEYVYARDLVEHPPAALFDDLLPGAAPPPALIRAYVVAGRRLLLETHLDLLERARSHDPRALLDAAQTVERSFAEVSRWSLRGRLAKQVAAPASVMVRNRFRCALDALLVAAELDGGEWPVDLLARDGSRLKRIERDGALIAAYSVGDDGDDDGGDPTKDLVFELYGRVTPPTRAK